MVNQWVFLENLRPFLQTLGWFVDYDFDDDDWAAIRCGIEDTDDELGRWFDYELPGSSTAYVRLARGPGSSVVFLELKAHPLVELKADTAVLIFASFRIRQD